MVDGPDTPQVEFEAMLRRYLLKLGSRYAPVLAGALALVLLLVFVPTTQPTGTGGAGGAGVQLGAGASGGSGGAGGGAPGGSLATGASGGSAGSAGGSAGSAGGGASGTGGGALGTGGGALGTGAGGAGGSASGVANPSGGTFGGGSASGVAKTGVHCGPGVRQFAFSKYAPLCVAAFQGDNGGATGQGVTGSTITLTFRLANTAQQAAINAAAGAANINQDAMVADFKSYVQYFNTQFELYGRHVVLKTYQGQGDYLQEDQGQGLGATQADAVTVHDMGAFGDLTFSLEASQPYEEDLAAEHVISFSSIGLSEQWFQQHAPYEYSVQQANGSTALKETVAVICRRMAGMPAIFAGDPIAQHTTRKFGIIYPDTPVYTSVINQAKADAQAQCGVTAARTVAYPINVANFEQEAVSTMASMKAAGVTSILCACDPIIPIFLTNAASQQNYLPEWFATWFNDPVARDYNQQVWSHSVTGGPQFPPSVQTEPFKAFQLAYPGKVPAEEPPNSPPYFYVAYYTLMHIFDGLQAAGPNLNAATFEAGVFSLPPSLPSDVVEDTWVFGPQVFDPVESFTLAYWNPNVISAFDNTKGAYQWCNGAQMYDSRNLAALGGPGKQLNCFGK